MHVNSIQPNVNELKVGTNHQRTDTNGEGPTRTTLQLMRNHYMYG